jgi:hypothetical protein
LRILKLLEEHHKQLAKALASTGTVKPADAHPPGKLQPENQKKDAEKVATTEKPKDAEKPIPAQKSIPAEKSIPPDPNPKDASPQTKPNLTHLSVRRPPRREMRSSIVSDLAAARGKPPAAQQRRALPTTPEVTAQHASGKVTTARATPQGPTAGHGPIPPPTVAPRSPTATPGATNNNDAFQQFFNSFETVFHKLSAPLAFAGLPLIPEQAPDEPDKSTKKGGRSGSTRATAEPDLTKIFSEPTLRALREDVGPAFGSHESFYVVPPSGGTRSYAAIVRGGTNDDNEDDEEEDDDDEIGSDAEFVDARESMGSSATPPTSIRASLSLGRAVAAATGGGKAKGKGKAGTSPANRPVVRRPQGEPRSANGKTMEELDLENGALRQLLDTQSRRLAMWEASAQSQSMALAQSLRLARTSARSPPAGAALPGGGGAQGGGVPPAAPPPESERVREMEEALNAERARREAAEHRLDKSQRENEKLLAVLGKYRDKWELLKESARKREKKKGDVRKGGPADD